MPDAELLRQYCAARAENAFAELVRRHLNLVYFAALRRAGGNETLAKEIAQDVFTALARQAASLAHHATLAGWLYTTTRFTATKALRAERRRKDREQEAHLMSEPTTEEAHVADWERLRPLLDAALDELNERDREAVLLRCLQGQPFSAIGATLNLSEDAARMRVDRALDKLHTLLAKRGVTSTSAALAAVLATQAVATAPAGLAVSIVSSALSGTAVAAAAGSLATMIYFMSASKIVVSVAVAGVLATGVAVYRTHQAHSAGAELEQARAARLASAARLAALEKNVAAAEAEHADRLAALERARLTKANNLAAAARQAAADAEKAKQTKALQQFLANDPELVRLRLEVDRAPYKSGSHGLFLKSMGFTPEQIDRAADIRVARKASEYAQVAAGLDLPPGDGAADFLPKFRAEFGDDAAERFGSFLKTWRETSVVGELSAFQSYQDEPLSRQQAQRLIGILAAAADPNDGQGNNYARYDWDRVLREAEPVVSPVQFKALQAVAGYGRNQVLLASVAKQSTSTPAK